MTTKLEFVERNTGWDVEDEVFTYQWPGVRNKVIGRIEQYSGYDEDGEQGKWCYLPSDGDSLSLSELDQIRHKLANLEQVRLLGLARSDSDGATRLAKIELNQNKEKSNG